jgi:hypothetical protein
MIVVRLSRELRLTANSFHGGNYVKEVHSLQ